LRGEQKAAPRWAAASALPKTTPLLEQRDGEPLSSFSRQLNSAPAEVEKLADVRQQAAEDGSGSAHRSQDNLIEDDALGFFRQLDLACGLAAGGGALSVPHDLNEAAVPPKRGRGM